jgi:hypothetical protein
VLRGGLSNTYFFFSFIVATVPLLSQGFALDYYSDIERGGWEGAHIENGCAF